MINPRKDLIIVGLILAVTGGACYLAYNRELPAPELTVLVCSDGMKGVRVVGVSTRLSLNKGVYWLRDSEGTKQSYLKSEWEWCATLSAEAAKKQGLIE